MPTGNALTWFTFFASSAFTSFVALIQSDKEKKKIFGALVLIFTILTIISLIVPINAPAVFAHLLMIVVPLVLLVVTLAATRRPFQNHAIRPAAAFMCFLTTGIVFLAIDWTATSSAQGQKVSTQADMAPLPDTIYPVQLVRAPMEIQRRQRRPKGPHEVAAPTHPDVPSPATEHPFGAAPPLNEVEHVNASFHPDSGLLDEYYPDEAKAERLSAQVDVICDVGENAHLDRCRIVDERPKGYGFGIATLTLMSDAPLTLSSNDSRSLAKIAYVSVYWKPNINTGGQPSPCRCSQH